MYGQSRDLLLSITFLRLTNRQQIYNICNWQIYNKSKTLHLTSNKGPRQIEDLLLWLKRYRKCLGLTSYTFKDSLTSRRDVREFLISLWEIKESVRSDVSSYTFFDSLTSRRDVREFLISLWEIKESVRSDVSSYTDKSSICYCSFLKV